MRRGLLQGIRVQRNLLAVGDRVKLTMETQDRAVLQEVLPRRSCISRLGSLRPRREHVIAANVDQLLAMQAVDQPPLNPRGLDRLLLLGEVGGVSCAVCLNKTDLVPAEGVTELLEIYRRIGYPVFSTCAVTGEGVTALVPFLRSKSTLLVGPSGVGKTTLLNRLIPGLQLRTGQVSMATGRGTHTTPRVDYLELPEGGTVLDSPGLRSIQPFTTAAELAGFYPDMREVLGACRFRDCLHRNEPGCAVCAAVARGAIAPERHDSYLRVLEGLMAEEDSEPGAPRRPEGE
jgi:ribosome biogenesis GTPase